MTTHEAGSDARRLGRVKGETELAERIEGHIERRASGRIRDLHVVCSDGKITLMGRSRTYHAKQLAQEAVFDLTEGQAALANQIVVC
jgi:osmotically-inducible protein OsmY